MKQSYLLSIGLGLVLAFGSAGLSQAEDLLQYLDLKSDQFTKSDMTREDVAAAIASAGGSVVDLSGKRLNNLDLSGLDLSKTKLEGAYINGTNFTGSNLNGVKLNKAWALKANFSNATLKGASLIETEMLDGICDGADFSGARVAANMSRASLLKAHFDAADLAAHGRGLLNHGVFTSAKLDGASFKAANLARAVFEFASLREADFAGANLSGSALAGADLTGANVAGANFNDADVNSTKLLSLRGPDAMIIVGKARNLEQALRD